ncbi:hypothetical protein [Methylosinus sporium]|uniref:hypothetical protein n=1 Tax=Methylosinus sporium TaxID=428 RepID=UPI00383A2A82
MRLFVGFCLFLALIGAVGMALSLFYAPPPAPDSGEMPPAFGFGMLLVELAAAL